VRSCYRINGLTLIIYPQPILTEYSELTAAIILIGVLGYALDWLAREAHARWTHREQRG